MQTQLVSYDQICKRLGVSRSTFNRLFVYPQRVKKIMVGPNSPRFDPEEVMAVVNAQEQDQEGRRRTTLEKSDDPPRAD